LGDAEKLPFASGVFDKVFGVCSVEHIPDNTAAFSEFARCMKKGGVLALTLDSLNYSAITEEKRREHAAMYHVAHMYDVPYVTRILNEAGFEVTHTQYLLCSPLSHWLNQVIVKNSKFQYLFFPISYPLTIFSDTYFGRKDEGWKLAVRAIKR
jgi:ubiquinone/menaquinone biosynthesis C-methylase UbiE